VVERLPSKLKALGSVLSSKKKKKKSRSDKQSKQTQDPRKIEAVAKRLPKNSNKK